MLTAALSGLIIAASCIWLGTTAATSIAPVNNGTNSFQTGQMNLTDDDNGTALYSLSGYLDAGQQIPTKCIAVTYNGNWSGDNFDGGPLTSWDLDKFSSNHDPDVTINGGEITIATNSNHTQVYPSRSSLLNRNYQAEIRQIPGNGQVSLNVWKDGDNHAFIVIYPTYPNYGIEVEVRSGGSSEWSGGAAYNSTTMKYVRFSSRGHDLRAQYSADSVTWRVILKSCFDGAVGVLF